MLDPSAVNRGSTVETQPYHHRTANEVDLGGGAKYRNDVVLDGTPLTAGNKLGYTPPMDAVTEYTVQSNAVDAEFGHNSGGVAVVTMKSGSNEYHGSAYYYGRDASLNAISDRTVHQHNDNPYWNAGATFGFPMLKNKLFVFSVFERIENTQSAGSYYSLPTELERQGDFSQSYNADGSLRVIYDPMTTRLVNGRYVRDPFPGNRIPQARWDALSSKVLGNLWDANSAPDDLTGFQNFKYTNENKFHYYNFSTRVDCQVNQNWKAWGRVSRIKTDQDATDFTNGADPMKIRNVAGSKRNGWNIAADTVYTFNPSTSLNVRGSFYQVEDKRDYPEMDIGDYSSFWSDPWWQPYMEGRPLVYAPSFTVEGARNTFGVANYWYQEPKGYSVHTRFNKYYTQALAEGRLRGPLEARPGRPLPLLRQRLPLQRDRRLQRRRDAGGDDRPPVGELPARDHERLGHRGAVHADADGQHRDVRRLRAGRLQDHAEAQPERRSALRVRGRVLGQRVPAAAESRHDRSHPRDAAGDRSADPCQRQGDHGAVGGTEQLPLQRCLLLHGGRQQAQHQRQPHAAHASRRPVLAARRQDGPSRRLRPLLYADVADHAGPRRQRRAADGRLLADDERLA